MVKILAALRRGTWSVFVVLLSFWYMVCVFKTLRSAELLLIDLVNELMLACFVLLSRFDILHFIFVLSALFPALTLLV